MHAINIASEILSRARGLRGGREVLFPEIDPTRTAHVAIDMQNGFSEPGALVEIAAARDIVPAINRISRAVRDAGGINIFVQFVVDDRAIAEWRTFYGGVFTPDFTQAMRQTFAPGSHGHALRSDLEIEPNDLTVDKARFGAFVPGTSGLEAMLNERGIDTLIITGCATNCCCESTAREAMQRDYRVVFVADATAALTDVEHNSALNSMTAIFADVVSAEEVVRVLGAAAARA